MNRPFGIPIFGIVLSTTLISPIVRAQDEYRVLPRDFNSDRTQQMMRSYLRKHVHAALDQRLNELEAALRSSDSIANYQKKRRAFLKWTLGDMPKRTPLNSRVTGVIRETEISIEKVLFESRPGFHVTANVYLPKGDGPFPAILHPVGHAENGKAYGDYQRANRLLARNGFVVLCYDPIGQGERKQLFSEDGKTPIRGSGEHQQLGVAPILLGQSLASYMVWDAVRAIDYLCSRPDVDSTRIGCTGNSGGGNLTSYLMACDDRIAAAAPGCFMTTHRRKNESPGPGDAEQNLFAQIREGLDHPDFIISRAPKPTLILAATRDFVPIEGSWEAFRQAKRVYSKLGYPERVQLIEAPEKHGFTRRLREGAVRFFLRWLQKKRVDVFEEDVVPVLADQELQVTPAGQVRLLPDERSLFDLYKERAEQLADRRPNLTSSVIRSVTRIRQLNELPRPNVQYLGEVGDTPKRLAIHSEPGIVLPALYWPDGAGQPVLIAPEDGMNSVADQARQLNSAGHPVLVVEVRDTGETKTRNWRFFGADYYIAHLLGRSWIQMQSEDLLVTARWLRDQKKADAVTLQAVGQIAPAGLHAAVLERGLISDYHETDALTSWHQLMTSQKAHPQIHSAVYGALASYDLPDLRRLIEQPISP